MIVNAYRVMDAGHLVELDPSETEAIDGRGEAPVWVDLEHPSAEELDGWLRRIEAPEVVRTVVAASDWVGSGAIAVDEAAAFTLPTFGFAGDRAVRVTGVAIGTVLLTWHADKLESLLDRHPALRRSGVLQEPTIAGLLSLIVRLVVQWSAGVERRLREDVARLSKRMDDGEILELEDLVADDQRLLDISATLTDQVAAVTALSTTRTSSLDLTALGPAFTVALDNLTVLDRSLDRLQKRVDTLRSRYASALAERTNKRLSFLTVLSAVFLPLTLIAGIYGMNFEVMPELGAPYAYPLTLLAMAAIAGGMLLYFWRDGWFG